MSRMATPTMDVVRFKEADVLCASGIVHQKNAFLSGWGNGIDNDATLTFSNGTDSTYDWATLHAEALEDMLTGLMFDNGKDTKSLNDLGMDENLSSDWNGTYEKKDGIWRHQ